MVQSDLDLIGERGGGSGPDAPGNAQPPVLALTTTSQTFAGRSGYSLLPQYMTGCEVLSAERKAPKGLLPRMAGYALRRVAVTDWYLPSSASLEWRAWQRIRNGFEGVVHVLWGDSDLGVLDFLVKPRTQKLCCTFHASPSELRQMIRYPDRLKKIKQIILMSSNQAGFFLDCGVERERITVVPHGVDTAYFRPGRPVAGGSFRVLSVGSYRRNFPLLKAVCVLLGNHPGLEFEIVTGRSFHPLFKDLPNVTCRANLTDAELLEAYQSASCYLMTAEEATANNGILESMSCGLPVVAESVGGIPEYVTAECAFLAAPSNAQQVVDAILAIEESSALCRRMAEASRRRALELDWTNVAGLTRNLYGKAFAE